MEKVKQHQPFSEIPSAMVREILGRVPIKMCLFTCKLVCKEWCRIVGSPEFPSFRRRCCGSRFTLLFSNAWVGGGEFVFRFLELKKSLNSGDFIGGVDDIIEVCPKLDTPCRFFYVLGHCNGVVFFASGTGEYFVCNLLSGQCVSVQNLHELKKKKKGNHTIMACTLGCCPVTGRFKVLVFLWDMMNNTHLAKIQDLGSVEWRSVGNSPLRNARGGCFLNGSSHWCGHADIWSFHFGKEKFFQIPIHDDIISSDYKEREKMLFVLDSCLCLGCVSHGNGSFTMAVWIMKEYGVKESWVRQFVIVSNE